MMVERNIYVRFNVYVNLRRVLHVGSWNVLSLSEDHRLSHLSDELGRLRVDMVGLSETKRPSSCETSSKGFTYYLLVWHEQWSTLGFEAHNSTHTILNQYHRDEGRLIILGF